MRVLYVAAEAAPIVKVGGLGDVAGSLPPALKRLGVDIRVAIPWYPEIDALRWKVSENKGIGETRLGDTDVPVYLLSRDVFANTGVHQAIVGTDEEERWFGGFCDAIIEFIKGSEWKPEVFHGNDWHVAQALEHFEKAKPEELRSWGYASSNLASLVTIHNLSYHTEVLRRAILSADLINAVSPSYAREILTEEFCEGLCAELRERKDDLSGVINGIDYDFWDPAKDAFISTQYGGENWMEGKKRNKEALVATLGFSANDRLLLGFVGRLDPHQKGVLVLAGAIERLVNMGCQVVILGSGNAKAEKTLQRVCERHPESSRALLKYDEDLAHQIYAGADALLIPSRFEPCGLIQMIAMKYGTLPIAHAVGGLKDTIQDGKNGILYENYDSSAFVQAVERAYRMFTDQGSQWGNMVQSAMKADFSWDRSAQEYVKLYERALEKSKNTHSMSLRHI